MNLTALSLVSAVKGVPPVLSNAERARWLRFALPAPTFNAYSWQTLPSSVRSTTAAPSVVEGGGTFK